MSKQAAVAHPALRLSLLGDFRLEQEGAPVRLYSRKVEGLLAYLILFPDEHPREKLAALFWGDSTDEQARTSLRVGLNNLRKQLPTEALLTDRETVQWDPAFPLWVDTNQIPTWANLPPLELQAQLLNYQDLLTDFPEEWLAPLRSQFRASFLETALQFVERARTSGEYTSGIEIARKILTFDAANETAHQHLIFCLSAVDDYQAALAQYEICRQALRETSGVEPSSATRDLYAKIKQQLEPRPHDTRTTNLPKPLTSFVGRGREMAELQGILANASGASLVTLFGAGGSGKTRLSIQVGRALLSDFPDGVWWVDLSPLTDANLVARQVAKAVGVTEQPYQELSETLIEALHNKQVLLIIDNCEHLVLACARLAEQLLGGCPQLKILATSRERLGVGGELLYQVPTLSLPAVQPLSLATLLLEYESVRLFVERARAVNPRFVLTDQNAVAVAHICQRLDGIPLAIELAAARVKLLAPEEIAARLDHRFALLTQGSRTALPRQQTLRALIDWSYNLLLEEERILYPRLSIFAGGFTLQAAEQICSAPPLHASSILVTLAQLVDKSLVLVPGQERVSRYQMLETVREYASDKLSETMEMETLRLRHLEFFLGAAQEAAKLQSDSTRAEWLRRLDADYENFRAALEGAIRHRNARQSLDLANALMWYWDARNYLVEGMRWFNEVLAATAAFDAEFTIARTEALTNAGTFLRFIGDFSVARDMLTRAVVSWRSLGDAALPQTANALHQLSYVFQDQGDIDSAAAAVQECESITTRLGDRVGNARALYRMADIVFDRGQIDLAREYFHQYLTFALEVRNVLYIVGVLCKLGGVERSQGNFQAAIEFYEQALEWNEDLPDWWMHAQALRGLGVVALAQDRLPRARTYLAESLAVSHQYGYLIWIAEGLAASAELARKSDEPPRAAKLLGASDAVFTKIQGKPPVFVAREIERTRAGVREKLGDAAYEAAWQAGKKLDVEQAIKLALGE